MSLEVEIRHSVGERGLRSCGAASPRRLGGLELGPAPIAVDENASPLERSGQEGRASLGVLQADELDVASDPPVEAAGEFGDASGSRLGQCHENVDIRMLSAPAGGGRADEDGETYVGLGTQGGAKRAQQWPVATEVAFLAQRCAEAPGAGALTVDQPFGSRSSKRPLRDVKLPGECAE